MMSEAMDPRRTRQQASGPCPAGSLLIEALNSGGCEAKQISSLMEVLTGHLDQAGEMVDPVRISSLAADVARIARDLTSRLSVQMFAAEQHCSAVSTLPPASPA